MEASVPEEVLLPLLHASDLSFSLEDCLQFLVEASKTDSGRSDLASRALLPSILRLLKLLPYPSSRHYLNLSLKVLRNLCAGETWNQNAFVDHNGSVLVSELLDSAIGDFETVRFGLQVLANVVLFGEKRQRDVWLRFSPERFFAIAKIRRRETCDPLCMILYTCFDGSSEIASELCSNEGLCIIAETVRTSSSVGSVEDYWLKLLVSRLCVEGDCFPEVFSKLYKAEVDDKFIGHRFTSEQAFILRMVSDIANERINEVCIPKDATFFILGLFKQSLKVFDFVSGERSELPTGSTMIDVMGCSLVIIRDTCAGGSLEELKTGNNNDSCDTVELLLSSGIIELLLDLLRKLEPPTTIKKALNQSASSKPCPYRGFRRDIVSVIANCAYKRKEVQDEIRERDGLFLMLQQCVTDDENPFLREWGLWCVRNLLEGNQENQKAVAELEIQGSVDVPQLREIGLRVEIDPNTSRPKLVNDTSKTFT